MEAVGAGVGGAGRAWGDGLATAGVRVPAAAAGAGGRHLLCWCRTEAVPGLATWATWILISWTKFALSLVLQLTNRDSEVR